MGILKKLLVAPEVKILKKYIIKYIDQFETSIDFVGLSGSSVLVSIKRDAMKMANTDEMYSILTESDAPNPEPQALHTIGEVVYYYLSKEPLVKIGEDSYCSADYRNPLGQLTESGKNLKKIAYSVIETMTEKGFYSEDSEYILNYKDVIDDATKSGKLQYS